MPMSIASRSVCVAPYLFTLERCGNTTLPAPNTQGVQPHFHFPIWIECGTLIQKSLKESCSRMPSQQSTLRGGAEPKQAISLANKIGLSVFLNTAFYPTQIVRTLIQIGHEPLPPRETYSRVWRTTRLIYPSFFAYMRHLYRENGLTGLYRGSFQYVTSHVVYLVTTEALKGPVTRFVTNASYKIGFGPVQDVPDNEDAVVEFKYSLQQAVRKFTISCILDTAATTVAHPFRVLALRGMAQTVGGETVYSGWISPFTEVFAEEGIQGFFIGLVPLILARWINNFVQEGLLLILNTLIRQTPRDPYQKIGNALTPHVAGYFGTLSMYPNIYTSNLVIIRAAKLMGASCPLIPKDGSWVGVLATLYRRGQWFYGTPSFSRPVPTFSVD